MGRIDKIYKNEQEAASCATPYNQVEDLQQQVQHLREHIKMQDAELLSLYRRLYSADKPQGY